MRAGVLEPLGAQGLDEVVVERGEAVRAHHPREEVVGERGVAGQDRSVQVGAEDPLGEHAVDAAHAVAVADRDRAERRDARARASSDRRGSRSR